MAPFFDVPLNLSHACRVARRILHLTEQMEERDGKRYDHLTIHAQTVVARLLPYEFEENDPPAEEAEQARQEVAAAARGFVDQLERSGLGFDRLGQAVRNLFECLEMGEEGAAISLRAGENPKSLQRPI